MKNNASKKKPKKEKTYNLEFTLVLMAIIFYFCRKWFIIAQAPISEWPRTELIKSYLYFIVYSWVVTKIIICVLCPNRSASSAAPKVYTLEMWNEEMDDLIAYHDKCAYRHNKLSEQRTYLLYSAYNMSPETKLRELEEINDELRELNSEIQWAKSQLWLLNSKRPL